METTQTTVHAKIASDRDPRVLYDTGFDLSAGEFWCSCPAGRRGRECKHIRTLIEREIADARDNIRLLDDDPKRAEPKAVIDDYDPFTRFGAPRPQEPSRELKRLIILRPRENEGGAR